VAQKKQSGQKSVKAVWKEEVKLRGQDLWNGWVLSQEWKREGVMDEQSCESEKGRSDGEGMGESEMVELVPEWGWQRDKGNWFQRQKGIRYYIYTTIKYSSEYSKCYNSAIKITYISVNAEW